MHAKHGELTLIWPALSQKAGRRWRPAHRRMTHRRNGEVGRADENASVLRQTLF